MRRRAVLSHWPAKPIKLYLREGTILEFENSLPLCAAASCRWPPPLPPPMPPPTCLPQLCSHPCIHSRPCRHTILALVCKQWAELVHIPPLLASVDVSILEGSDGLPRLRSLEAWLARRAAGQVRQLQLKAVLLLDDHAEHAIEAAAALTSALAPLASSLCDLSLVSSDLPLPLLDHWLAPLVGLTSLSLATDYTDVSIAGPPGCLSALQRLRLSIVEGDVSVAPEASLPPALTHLWFGTVDSPLPSQVSLALSQMLDLQLRRLVTRLFLCGLPFKGCSHLRLPPCCNLTSHFVCLFPPSMSSLKVGGLRHLKELAVVRTTTSAEQYAPLARLHSSLTALNITDGAHVPGCLDQLTALRSLSEEERVVCRCACHQCGYTN